MLALRGRGVALEGGSHCPVVRGGEAEVCRRPTEGGGVFIFLIAIAFALYLFLCPPPTALLPPPTTILVLGLGEMGEGPFIC